MTEQTGNLPAAPDSSGASGAPAAPSGGALVPRQKSAVRRKRRIPVLGDGDHHYEAVQHKLDLVVKAFATAVDRLEGLDKRARATAKDATSLAADIADAQLDEKFVEDTQEVSTAQTEAAKAVRAMLRAAQEAEKSAHAVKRAHARHYRALHRVRKGRRWRTPKPGFFRR
ncbi:conjugal transfer protein TraB [Kitasatospora sp. NPDC058965]|uniref:conjugal transfer protein TraB n=1 Tax=Kitasatospora sp. NPDC058965 TaxID=3346682 RepID=UPI0036C2FE00